MAASSATKVATVIVNRTRGPLVLKVGNRNCATKLATIGFGREYKVEVDVNWTYQEFSLHPVVSVDVAVPASGKLVNSEDQIHQKVDVVMISSDDCCDFERITVTDHQSGSGEFQVDKVARWQYNSSESRVPNFVTGASKKWRSYFTWPPKLQLNWRALWTF